MQFIDFSKHLNKLETTESRLLIRDYIYKLYSNLNKDEIKIATYLLLSRINLAYDNKEMNIGHSLIISAISKSFGIPEIQIKKTHLKNGDLGITAELFAKERKQKFIFSKKLNLTDVYNTLKKISNTTGKNSSSMKIDLISSLYNNSTELETKYITKLILKTLRLNLGIHTIIESLALKIMKDKNYNNYDENMHEYKKIKENIDLKQSINNDLGYIAELIWTKGYDAINEIKIKPGIPIKSALCEREKSSDAIINRLGYCIVEGKYDGFRTQIHKDKKVEMFSRRSENITNYFPEFLEILNKNKHSFILDSEAIGYDNKKKKFLSFQETIKRKRKYNIKEISKDIPIKLIVFDILYLDNKEIFCLPLKERRKILENLIKEINDENIVLSENIYTDNKNDLQMFFESCLNKNLEGVIAKDLTKPYVPGSRDFSWIKLKKNYLDGVADTLDVCVIGFFFGNGKNKNLPSSLLCAIYDSELNTYNAIAKVGSGLTEEIMKDLKEKFKDLELNEKPLNYNSDLTPNKYLEPKIIIEIIVDEITKSQVYKNTKNLSFRFPRFIRIREDKDSQDTTTLEEIDELYNLQKGI